jgi:thiamine-phosphate pyrophosphorylase
VGGAWGLGDRRLYLCTPDREDLEDFVGACIDGGVDVVQLREKSASDRRIVERAKLLSKICRDRGVPFILNDRPDLAVDCGADGVHLGQDDISAQTARRLLGQDAVLGLSTHALSELRQSAGEPVDYISAGPVVETPTKPGRPGTGIDYVVAAVARSERPVFVTGGVTPESVPGLCEAGVRHFVVVRYLTQSTEPKASATRLRRAIEQAIQEADQIS